MRKSILVSLVAAGLLVVGTSQVSAHGGIDDGDDGEEGEGGGDVQGGTALEELYPGYYEFQGRYVSFANTFSQIQAGRGGVTSTIPAGQTPFDGAPAAP